MARIIFATVGTTSFEGFVQSLCSVSFLTAIAHHHSLRRRQQQQQQQGQHHNATDHCVELVIQYGRGQCPREYLSKAQHHYEASTQPTTHQSSNNTEKINEDDGSIILSIPIDTSLSLSPKEEEKIKIFIRWYRFQPSLSEDMQRSSMILCHAGAGTLLEALNLSSEITNNNNNDENTTSEPKQKMIINAVINSTLMNNHQSELAQELERRQHIKVTWNPILEWGTEEGASKFWKDIGTFQPVLFSGGGNRRVVDDEGNSVSCKSEQGRGNAFVNKFQTIVDRVMGFSTDDIDDVIQSTQY